eukprot:5829878-Amphidinium_carterae.1
MGVAQTCAKRQQWKGRLVELLNLLKSAVPAESDSTWASFGIGSVGKSYMSWKAGSRWSSLVLWGTDFDKM